MMGSVDICPASVLVLESHPLMREALCSAIAAEADLLVIRPTDDITAATLIIATGPQAILLPQRPDIVLLALGNSGQVELKNLKALREALPDTPILALTGDDVPGQEQAALEAGAQAVFAKTASREELIGDLRDILRRLKINMNIHP